MLEIKYIRLDEALPKMYDKNAKAHDIGAIITSIRKYGFRNPPIHDATTDAILAGNGRVEALGHMYKQAPDDTPQDIDTDDTDGMWLVPIVYGMAAESVKQAEAYLIDDNNLTAAGGSLTALDISRMWDMDGYLALLENAVTETVSVDLSDFALMSRLSEAESNLFDLDDDEEPAPREKAPTLPKLTITFDDKESLEDARELLKAAMENNPEMHEWEVLIAALEGMV